MKTKLIFSGLLLMAVTTLASSQNTGAGQRQNNRAGRGSAYADDNRNGICDYFENRNPSASGNKGNVARKFNMQGKGRQNCQGQRKNWNYIDSNKNGICDRYETATKKSN